MPTQNPATPVVTLTMPPPQAEALVCLFREEARRLEALNLPPNENSGAQALRAVAEAVNASLNTLFPNRAAFIADHD